MKTVFATIVAVLIVQMLTAVVILYSGLFSVGATDPHWSLTHGILEMTRVRSIRTHAAGIKVPDGLSDHKRVVAGTSHFAEHCSLCHSAPGVGSGEMAKGMHPHPR
jgi:hypothetical protein